MEWIYVATAAIAVIATTIDILMIKVPARIRWVRRGFFFVLAVFFYITSSLLMLDLHARVTGYFIAVLLTCFSLWRQGLATWGVVAGLSATRVWNAISIIELAQDDKRENIYLEAYVGSIRVSRLRFRRSQTDITAFLQTHAPMVKVRVN